MEASNRPVLFRHLCYYTLICLNEDSLAMNHTYVNMRGAFYRKTTLLPNYDHTEL